MAFAVVFDANVLYPMLTATLFAHSAARLGEDEVAALDEDESLS